MNHDLRHSLSSRATNAIAQHNYGECDEENFHSRSNCPRAFSGRRIRAERQLCLDQSRLCVLWLRLCAYCPIRRLRGNRLRLSGSVLRLRPQKGANWPAGAPAATVVSPPSDPGLFPLSTVRLWFSKHPRMLLRPGSIQRDFSLTGTNNASCNPQHTGNGTTCGHALGRERPLRAS